MVYSVASGIPRGMGVSGYLVHGCIRVSGTKVYGTAWLNLTSKYLPQNRVRFQGALKPQYRYSGLLWTVLGYTLPGYIFYTNTN